MEKICKKCWQSKEHTCFSKNKTKKFGLSDVCKDCCKIYADVYRATHTIYKKIENIFYVNNEGFLCEERWKDIIGYEGLYRISDLGRVISIQFKIGDHLLKPGTERYLRVVLVKDGVNTNYAVHRLVGIHFLPNPENKPDINHKFGNTKDNRYFMIEWCTKKENSQHALRTGLNWNVGENSILAKLSEKQALEIFSSKLSAAILSKKYKVTDTNIRLIKSGKNWGYITGKKR